MPKTQSSQTIAFIKRVRSIRAWEDANLPVTSGRMSVDLFIKIADACSQGEVLTIKSLVSSLNYSERGIRQGLDRFIEAGFCEIIDLESDKRSKVIAGTQLGRKKFTEFREVVNFSYDSTPESTSEHDPVI